jgi:hypothetical protein
VLVATIEPWCEDIDWGDLGSTCMSLDLGCTGFHASIRCDAHVQAWSQTI